MLLGSECLKPVSQYMKVSLSDSDTATTETTSPTMTIGLLWHSMNSGNLGVGALTVSNIEIVERAARKVGIIPRFIVIGWHDKLPRYRAHMEVEVVTLRMKDFVSPRAGLFAILRRCDIVLDIAAGDSFTDIYGTRRIATQLASKILTVLARRPLVLCPQTMGPFCHAHWRMLARWVIGRAAGVATRDVQSTSYLREIGYRGDIIEATDVAMRLPYDAPAQTIDDFGQKTSAIRVGINVSGLLYFGGYSRKNMFDLNVDYPRLIRRIVAHFDEMPNVEIHLVGHVLPDYAVDYAQIEDKPGADATLAVEDDLRASHAIAQDFPAAVVAPFFTGPSSAKSYIAGMDFFMGARMHACIAAFSTGVPVVPMAYSRKFAGLFGTLGYNRTVDCINGNEDEIFAAVVEGFDARGAMRREVYQAMQNCAGRLDTYEDLIHRTLETRR